MYRFELCKIVYVENKTIEIRTIFERNFSIERKTKNVGIAIASITKMFFGLAIPISHFFEPRERMCSHKYVVTFRADMKIPFGMCKSSEKNIMELKKRNIMINGAKIMFPITVIIEIGIPQPTRIGREVAVIMN
jgi:hypothetical protein